MQKDGTMSQMDKDDWEHMIAQMVYSGILQIDFGFTAYATTAYLKCSPQAAHLLTGQVLTLWSLYIIVMVLETLLLP